MQTNTNTCKAIEITTNKYNKHIKNINKNKKPKN